MPTKLNYLIRLDLPFFKSRLRLAVACLACVRFTDVIPLRIDLALNGAMLYPL